MKKSFSILAAAVFLMAMTMLPQAALAGNPITGIAKGAAGLVYHAIMAPVNMLDGDGCPITALADITRAPVKAVEEVAYGLAFQDTGRDIEDIGIINEAIENDTGAHVFRNCLIGIAGTHTAPVLLIGGTAAIVTAVD